MLRNLIVLLFVLSFTASRSYAEEPVEAFLAALQERGHFDVALRYLDRMADSPLAPDGFKDEIQYRRGMLQVNAARGSKNAATRRQSLDLAESSLQQFIAQHPQHTYAPLARSQLGNVIVERARSIVLRSKASADKTALLQEAAKVYETAFEALTKSREEIATQYRSLVSRRDPESKKQLDSTKTQYVQTYLAIARVLFEQAETVQDDAANYEAKLTEAATAFAEIADKYRSFGAGIFALLYEGECYQLMGQHRQALTYFKELLQNPDNSPPIRRLKTRALTKSIECWLASDKQNGADRSINAAKEWMKTPRGLDNQPEWYKLRLALARAYHSKSTVASKDIQATRAISEARKLANSLAKRRSPVQKEAQTLLVALGRNKQDSTTTDKSQDPGSLVDFAEAHAAANKELDEFKLAGKTVSILTSQLETVKSVERRAEISSKVQEAEELKNTSGASALELFERAAALATNDDTNQLNGIRYYLSYLYYQQGHHRRSAVLGSFVASRFPDHSAALSCASVALAARQRLYQEATADERQLQLNKIADIAQLMITKWPGQKQANAAMSTLLNVTIQSGEFDKAEEYLARIPADSPKRANAELRTGQAVWREYLQGIVAQQKGQAIYSIPELDELKQRAQQLLVQGVQRLGKSKPNESVIRSALSLAQLHVDSGQPSLALEVMQQPYGALTLVDANSPWLKRIPGLSTEAFKTAIRAHVATAATSGDPRSSIDAAQRMLQRLKELMQAQPDGQKKMINIYVGLAQDLERQLTAASPQARRALSKGFESFLQAAAQDSEDIAVLNWVGETFYSLGNSMVQGEKSSPEAQTYFTKASEAYARVLTAASKGDSKLSANAITQVEVRQAMALRQLGKFSQSIDLFASVLGKRSQVLNIQLEAAKTLQQWGRTDPKAYDKAIQGDRPGKNGRNVIWGWGRIANVVSKNADYRDAFHLARYNIALCRYQSALLNAKGQKDLLKRAKSDINFTRQLVGLGSKVQRSRYNSLMKQIQSKLGEEPKGISE